MCRRGVPLEFLLTSALLTVMFAALSQISCSDSVRLERLRVDGAYLHLITADLNDPSIGVHVGLPEKGISHSEPFMNMVRRRAPIAAVTGTYFDLRSQLSCGNDSRRRQGGVYPMYRQYSVLPR